MTLIGNEHVSAEIRNDAKCMLHILDSEAREKQLQ